MSKEAFKAKKKTTFIFRPDDLVLVDDKMHPLYDPRINLPVDESMVQSILTLGVIEPVVICKIDDNPVVVDGRQRVKAARIASQRSESAGGMPIMVQCVYRTGTEQNLFSVLVTANEHRTDDSPIEKAEKANRMISYGSSIKEVAESFGVETNTIRYWMKLLELPPEEREAVAAKKITVTKALAKDKQPGATRAPRIRKKEEIQNRLYEEIEKTGGELTEFASALRWVLRKDL